MTPLILFVASFYSPSASADQIWLENGDRLTGRILYMSDGKLAFSSKIAGRVDIPWKNIKTIESDDALLIELKGAESDTSFRMQAGNPGTVFVGEKNEIQLAQIEGILRPREHKRAFIFEGNLDVSTDIKRERDDKSDSIETRLDTRLVDFDWRHVLKSEYTYETEEDLESERHYTVEYNLDRFFAETWYWRLHASIERDYFDDDKRDNEYGTGPGYQFWDDERGRLGINVTYARYRFARTFADDPYALDRLRLNAAGVEWDLTHMLRGTDLEAYTSGNMLFPDVFDVDYVFKTNYGLRYHLNRRVNFSTYIDYDGIKAKTINESNKQYKFGVGVDW